MSKPKQPDEELVHLLAEIKEAQELSREGFDALTKYCISGPAFEKSFPNGVEYAYTFLSEFGYLAILKEAEESGWNGVVGDSFGQDMEPGDRESARILLKQLYQLYHVRLDETLLTAIRQHDSTKFSHLCHDPLTHSILYNNKEVGLLEPKSSTSYDVRDSPEFLDPEMKQAQTASINGQGLVIETELMKRLGDGSFDEAKLKIAVALCNIQYKAEENVGEVYFQQCVYSFISHLFMAFSKDINYYAADQDVHSLLYAMKKTSGGGGSKVIVSQQPDSSLTICPRRDALSSLEIKADPGSFNQSDRRDFDKCVLLVGSTAEVLRFCGIKEDAIRLPFVIARGNMARIYVVGFENGQMTIKCIMMAGNRLFQMASSAQIRSESFVSLAFLLDRARKITDEANFHNTHVVRFPRGVTNATRLFSKRKSRDDGTKPKKASKQTGDDGDKTHSLLGGNARAACCCMSRKIQ